MTATALQTFTDKFDRSDREIDGDNGWEVVGGVNGLAEIVNSSLQNATTTQNILWQRTTLQGTEGSRARCVFAIAAQGDGNMVGIGALGSTTLVAGDRIGVGVYVHFNASDGRTIKIVRSNGTSGQMTDVKEVNCTPLTVQPDPGSATTDLGVLNELEILVTTVPAGVRVRGYLNTKDYSEPTIEAVVDRDTIDFSLQKAWWIGLGEFASSLSAANVLAVQSFYAQDWHEGGTSTQRRGDLMTRKELRERAYLIGERNSTSNDLPPEILNDFLNYAQEDIINDLGDSVPFLRRLEDFTLSADAQNEVTLPTGVLRVLDVFRTGTGVGGSYVRAGFHVIGYEDDGRVKLCVPSGISSETVRIEYVVQPERMDDDADYCAIPGRHIETLLMATVRRMARHGGDPALEQSVTLEYLRLMKQMKKQMNVEKRGRGDRLRNATSMSTYGDRFGVNYPTGY